MRQNLFSTEVRRSNWHGALGQSHQSPLFFPLCFARSLVLRVGLVYAQLFGHRESRCLPFVFPCGPKFPQLQNLPCDSGRFSNFSRNFRRIRRYFREFYCLIGKRCCIRVRSDSAFFRRYSCRHITILCLPRLLRVREEVVLLEAASADQQNPELKLTPTRHAVGRGVSQLSNP